MLVLLFFMHVRYSSRLIWVVVSSMFFWLFILLALTLSVLRPASLRTERADPTRKSDSDGAALLLDNSTRRRAARSPPLPPPRKLSARV
jgi:hypothetical protein